MIDPTPVRPEPPVANSFWSDVVNNWLALADAANLVNLRVDDADIERQRRMIDIYVARVEARPTPRKDRKDLNKAA